MSAEQWPDHLRLSDIEPQFVCKACGKRGAEVRPDFSSTKNIFAECVMLKPPDSLQWIVHGLSPDRQGRLEAGLSFEKIASRVRTNAQIVSSKIEPYDTPPTGEEDGRQIVFAIHLDLDVSDLLWNARDGLRGRYWQSPDYGFLANRHILGELTPKLLSFVEHHHPALITRRGKKPNPMNATDISASLGGVSAKIWPREYTDDRSKNLLSNDHLEVSRWANKSHPQNPGRWRKSPAFGDWEIKGALLGLDRTEFIPESKLDRSCQIHQFGFS